MKEAERLFQNIIPLWFLGTCEGRREARVPCTLRKWGQAWRRVPGSPAWASEQANRNKNRTSNDSRVKPNPHQKEELQPNYSCPAWEIWIGGWGWL